MKIKALALFVILFLAVGYGMSLIQDKLPDLGSSSANWAETSGVTAIILILLWEMWLRKDAIAKKDG
jgi:hypothetical protein